MKHNKLVISLFIAILAGCSSLQVNDASKINIVYEDKTVSEPYTLCYKNKKTGNQSCSTSLTSRTIILKEVSVARTENFEECVITFHGTISEETKNAFLVANNRVNRMNCKRKIVVLSSPGGLVNEAIQIGNLIRKEGYITLFDGQKGAGNRCSSSCTLLFIAGQRRVATENPVAVFSGKFGFHQWKQTTSMGVLCSDTQSMKRRLSMYANTMLPKEAAEKFVEITVETECKRITNFTPTDLFNFGISSAKEL